jgi:hypothetical protein
MAAELKHVLESERGVEIQSDAVLDSCTWRWC